MPKNKGREKKVYNDQRDRKDPWIYSRKNDREGYSCLPEFSYACTY